MNMKEKRSCAVSPQSGGTAFTAMIIIYLLITFVGQAILLAFSQKEGVIFSAVCATFSSIAIFAVILLFSKKFNASTFNLCGVRKFKAKYLSLSLHLSISMFFGLGFLNTIIANGIESLGGKVSGGSFPLNNIGEVIIFTILLAILPAIFEEMFFRGIILSSLRGGGFIVSALASGVFFALYHCSPVQLFYQLIYGFGLALLYNLSSSVLPCIISHFLNNFAVILLEYLKIDMSGVLFNPLVIAIGILGLALFFAFSLIVIKKRNEMKNQKTSGVIAEFLLPYGLFGVLACLALAVVSIL